MFSADRNTKFLAAFEGFPGLCKGSNLDIPGHQCEDARSNNPVCTECQEECDSQKACLGFQVNLHDKSCNFKGDNISISSHTFVWGNNICFKKGTPLRLYSNLAKNIYLLHKRYLPGSNL